MPITALSERHPDARGYLNTASIGLPDAGTLAAVRDALDRWQRGGFTAEEPDESVASSRAVFARLVGVSPADVTIGAQVSALVGLVAASLPRGTEVLLPEEEFTSVLFPFLAREPALTVRTVPFENLAAAIDETTGLVAFSLVLSADGRIADVEAVTAAAARHGARTLVDATQACGWLPVDATRFDVTVAAAYKWLAAPRGTAFLAAGDQVRGTITPLLAGWYAAERRDDAFFGAPLRLAADARRLDTSPAWFSWLGTAAALAHLETLGVARVHAHDVALARMVRNALDLDETDSAIVSVTVSDEEQKRLERAGVRAGTRRGRLRLAFHHYNDEEDVARVLDALGR